MPQLDIPPTLTAAAVAVLQTVDPWTKAIRSAETAKVWRAGEMTEIGDTPPPARPARPARPELKAPRELPRRRLGAGPAGRIALLHALAHIELNAIDLAWDIIARFAGTGLLPAFADDWVAVADEEAKHFVLLSDRLAALGARYGDLPAHDGLWQAAEATAGDLLARLAVVPLVLEARGLDVTPGMINRLDAVGDPESASVLRIIYEDEIGHVAVGKRWFDHFAVQENLDPVDAWQNLIRLHFKGTLKPPFNVAARDAAGLDSGYYIPLVEA